MREAEWAAGQLRAIAQRERARMPRQGGAVPRREQVRRFLSGEERWRLERGQVTPSQWAAYEREMLRRLGAEG